MQPGARVEEFDKLCEVQSDKASVEITSRFTGVIKKLHYDSDDMAVVGRPLVDIDIQGDVGAEDAALIAGEAESGVASEAEVAAESEVEEKSPSEKDISQPRRQAESPGRHAGLATPAVRHLTRELGIELADISGTGRDGRVLKEDVQKHAAARDAPRTDNQKGGRTTEVEADTVTALTPTQTAMFKTMTKSLAIPHFLYTDTIDTTALTALRRRLNAQAKDPSERVSALAFILKAMSQALAQYPILNARLDATSDAAKPTLVYRAAHNIGIAVDTPSGLFVPVVQNVEQRSIAEIAREITHLSALGRDGKLSAANLSGGTFSVSNVGSIGGGIVSPVIVEGQMAIVGIGRAKVVPAFDAQGAVVAREECPLSWSADHRVVDGATVARCAEHVRDMLEEPASMLVGLR